jgi:diguanylate cyclase (GGDEF)-like protein/PAS domain S-box-containing protein
MRLLIAEDEAIIARDLATTVEALGHVVLGVVDTGEAALVAAAQQRPDMVLMDIQLAGPLDGIAAAQRLQSELHIPVIYLTIHADAATVRRAMATAPAGYLLKPVDERALWSTLEVAQHQRQLQHRLQASEARFATTLRSIGDAVLVTDLAGMLTFVNIAAARMSGQAPDDLVGRPLGALLLADSVAEVLATGALVPLAPSTLLLTHDGQAWPVEGSAAPMRDDAGRLTGIVIVVHEVRSRQAAEAAQRQAEEALRDANTQLSVSLAELERRTTELTVLSELGGSLMRCETQEEAHTVIAHAARWLFPDGDGALFVLQPGQPLLDPVLVWGADGGQHVALHPRDCSALRERQVLTGTAQACSFHCRSASPELAQHSLCAPLVVENEVLGVLHVSVLLDRVTTPGMLTARRQLAQTLAEQGALGMANLRLRAALREQATRDPLTGLFNRRYLEDTLTRELHRAARDHYPVGVIMLDVDHFKRFNDRYGHDAGDSVLRDLSQLLLATVRASDVVCRYGGEEFVLMLPAAPLTVVVERAEAIRTAIAALVLVYHGQSLPPITASLGVTIVADDQASVSDALARADAALYMAKGAGRDRVVALAPGGALVV